jgi:CheY-like chemotaxis protein
MKPRLLVVDDERDYLDMLRDTLGDAYDLVCATSAKEAIEAFHRERDLKLAIIDYMMPGGNGIRLARSIADSKRPIAMVIFSAYLPSGMREWEGQMKLRVVAKGDGPETLSQVVTEMIGSGVGDAASPTPAS